MMLRLIIFKYSHYYGVPCWFSENLISAECHFLSFCFNVHIKEFEEVKCCIFLNFNKVNVLENNSIKICQYLVKWQWPSSLIFSLFHWSSHDYANSVLIFPLQICSIFCGNTNWIDCVCLVCHAATASVTLLGKESWEISNFKIRKIYLRLEKARVIFSAYMKIIFKVLRNNIKIFQLKYLRL